MKQDQRAMLKLLLERGQSYEDIASLLGVSVDDARTRARAALAELVGTDPDTEVGLTD
ncbi:MAG: sigma factor-like helix-turn-helix DNA-binding protein, partial [Solirubrobacterales bacterium]